jgi:PBSX family phage terminase large subunit
MREINFDYKPIPIHAPFHVSVAPERFLFGAFGSGKTWALCAEAIAWCLEQPGIRGLIARKTVPELRDTTETVFFEILPHELYKLGEVKRTGGHVESFTFPNGSKVLFRAIDEWQKLKSLNVGFIAFDEADEFDEETYQGMLSRVRQREPTPEASALGFGDIRRRGVWSASNPAGHNWLWRRGVNTETKADGAEYFKSTSFDNPYLPEEYFDYLLQYPEQWVKRYVLCQFDDFAGQIYEEWNWDEHVLKDDLKLTEGRQVYWMGCDPGTRNPTAGLWVVLDYDGEISGHKRAMIGVAEYKENYQAAQQHAKAWRQIEAEKKMGRVPWRVADPVAMWTKDRGSNMGLNEQYRRLGYIFQPGPKDHKDRIPMLGQLIAGRRFLLTKNCPQTFEAIKNYQWEDLTTSMKQKGVDAPERPLKKEDDLVDCAQYLSSRFISPKKAAAEFAPQTFGEEVTQNIKKQLARKRVGVVDLPV